MGVHLDCTWVLLADLIAPAGPDAPRNSIEEPEKLRDEWLSRLCALVDMVESWARELGWASRRIEKEMKDSEIGGYLAPALLIQKETSRVLLEPIARSAPAADGIVDLYLMPAYDDVASLTSPLASGVCTTCSLANRQPRPFESAAHDPLEGGLQRCPGGDEKECRINSTGGFL